MEPTAGQPANMTVDELALDDLDVRIVESGDAAEALQCSTDNGCDTRKSGDC